MLVLHLVPNGVRSLHACLEFVVDTHLVERLFYRTGELTEEHVALFLRRSKLALDGSILFRMLVFEAEVFEFGLDFVETEAVGKRSVDVERLAGNLVLLVGGLTCESAHIVKAVANLYQYHAYVVAHGEK